MIIRVASKRPPKVNGIRRAAELLSAQFGIAFSGIIFESEESGSAVADTPLSVGELMQGAEYRAKNIFHTEGNDRLFTVGVEGGLFIVRNRTFLQSWACVYDGSRTTFGASGCIELPQSLARDVVDRHIELGVAIDTFAKRTDVRSKQGTFGILTDDLVTREDSFAAAAVNAFMPFFNEKIYGVNGNK
jgi:inosine/xanthosine triphosphatase